MPSPVDTIMSWVTYPGIRNASGTVAFVCATAE
jgi:hypothetical protein